MAQETLLTPFIKKTEGGLSNRPDDPAAKNMCPFPDTNGIKYHTNRGWTWATFSSIMGSTAESAVRFYAMTDADWDMMFSQFFWKPISGNDINSQRIANMIGDWFFNSGNYATIDTQAMLDNLFNNHLVVDGRFGPQSIAAINNADEPTLYNDLIQKRQNFYQAIVDKNPSESIYLNGWLNRIKDIVAYNETL